MCVSVCLVLMSPRNVSACLVLMSPRNVSVCLVLMSPRNVCVCVLSANVGGTAGDFTKPYAPRRHAATWHFHSSQTENNFQGRAVCS
jgi:hypothetical protein